MKASEFIGMLPIQTTMGKVRCYPEWDNSGEELKDSDIVQVMRNGAIEHFNGHTFDVIRPPLKEEEARHKWRRWWGWVISY
jgi:hypothetical protein